MTLSLEAKNYIERASKLPSLATLSPKEARRIRTRTVDELHSDVLKSIVDQQIVMRDGVSITVRIYTPKQDQPLPVIMYYHGGGWVINDINTSHESCIELAHVTNRIVVSVNYRLAPEYKFPIPVYDAFDSLQWVVQNLVTLNATDEISVAGDSAGGNLATVVASLATKENIRLESQILLYPVTELTYSSNSYLDFRTGFGLDRDVMQWFGSHYLNHEEEASNPLVAPLQADVSGLPKTMIIAAEHDVLRDEAIAYADKLVKANVKVELHIAKGLVHSYFTNNDLFHHEIATTIQKIDFFLK